MAVHNRLQSHKRSVLIVMLIYLTVCRLMITDGIITITDGLRHLWYYWRPRSLYDFFTALMKRNLKALIVNFGTTYSWFHVQWQPVSNIIDIWSGLATGFVCRLLESVSDSLFTIYNIVLTNTRLYRTFLNSILSNPGMFAWRLRIL